VIGAGFQMDDGFVASARIEQLDLFRTGIQLALDAKISARQQRFAIGVADPTLFGTDLALGANLYTERRVLPASRARRTGGSLTLSHALGPHVRGFVGYRLEEIGVTPDVLAIARGTDAGDPFRGGRYAALRAGLEYNTLEHAGDAEARDPDRQRRSSSRIATSAPRSR